MTCTPLKVITILQFNGLLKYLIPYLCFGWRGSSRHCSKAYVMKTTWGGSSGLMGHSGVSKGDGRLRLVCSALKEPPTGSEERWRSTALKKLSPPSGASRGCRRRCWDQHGKPEVSLRGPMPRLCGGRSESFYWCSIGVQRLAPSISTIQGP